MPHFVIDCSKNVFETASPEKIMQTVYDTANASGLFAANDVKVRINPYLHYKIGDGKKNFLHIFGNIMEGRTTEQKADLSQRILEGLNQLLPDMDILSMNIREFEMATYCNKALLDPKNTSKNRHFKQ